MFNFNTFGSLGFFYVKFPLCGFTFSFRTVEVYFDIFIIHHNLVAIEISGNRFF